MLRGRPGLWGVSFPTYSSSAATSFSFSEATSLVRKPWLLRWGFKTQICCLCELHCVINCMIGSLRNYASTLQASGHRVHSGSVSGAPSVRRAGFSRVGEQKRQTHTQTSKAPVLGGFRAVDDVRVTRRLPWGEPSGGGRGEAGRLLRTVGSSLFSACFGVRPCALSQACRDRSLLQ